MIRLQGVSKRFGELTALETTDLILEQGSTTVLIGPSGCGKSTLLRVLIGLVAPDTGSVQVWGRLLERASVRELRLRMGYLIQDGGLFPHLTASQNVCLMARHLGWPGERIQERLRELCELTRFPPERLQRFPAELSGGQRQRVGLMRALMLDPDLLLLDEPMAALDPMIRAELQEDLRAIFAGLGKSVVMVTHDLAEAAFFGDQIVLMRAGRIVQRGSIDELSARPAEDFVSRFLRAQRSLHMGGTE